MKRAAVYTLRIWDEKGQELGTVRSDQALEILRFGHSLRDSCMRVVEFLPEPPQEGRTIEWSDFTRIYGGQTSTKAQ